MLAIQIPNDKENRHHNHGNGRFYGLVEFRVGPTTEAENEEEGEYDISQPIPGLNQLTAFIKGTRQNSVERLQPTDDTVHDAILLFLTKGIP